MLRIHVKTKKMLFAITSFILMFIFLCGNAVFAAEIRSTLSPSISISEAGISSSFEIKLIDQKLISTPKRLSEQDELIVKRIGLIDEIERSGIKKAYLNIFKGISPSTFYRWKRKYRFNDLTKQELKRFRAGYQSVLKKEIEEGFDEIDGLVQNIKDKANSVASTHDAFLTDFWDRTSARRSKMASDLTGDLQAEDLDDVITGFEDINQMTLNLEHKAIENRKIEQQMLSILFSNSNMRYSGYFDFYRANNILDEVKDKIGRLEEKEDDLADLGYYQWLLRYLGFYFDSRFRPDKKLRNLINELIAITDEHEVMVAKRKFLKSSANVIGQGI